MGKEGSGNGEIKSKKRNRGSLRGENPKFTPPGSCGLDPPLVRGMLQCYMDLDFFRGSRCGSARLFSLCPFILLPFSFHSPLPALFFGNSREGCRCVHEIKGFHFSLKFSLASAIMLFVHPQFEFVCQRPFRETKIIKIFMSLRRLKFQCKSI